MAIPARGGKLAGGGGILVSLGAGIGVDIVTEGRLENVIGGGALVMLGGADALGLAGTEAGVDDGMQASWSR